MVPRSGLQGRIGKVLTDENNFSGRSAKRVSKLIMHHGRYFIRIDCRLARQPFKCDYKFTVLATTQLKEDRSVGSGVVIPRHADVVRFCLIKIHQWNQPKNGGSKAAANIVPEVDLRNAAHGNGEALTMLHEDDCTLVHDDLDGLILTQGQTTALILQRVCVASLLRLTAESRCREEQSR